LNYRRTVDLPGWIGSRQDLLSLAETMSESVEDFKQRALTKHEAVSNAVAASPPAVLTLMLLLNRERQESVERAWATTAEVVEGHTGLVRTGAADVVLRRVEERHITEVQILAPAEAAGPQVIARFRPSGVQVQVDGEDEGWVRGEADRLKAALGGRLPPVFALRDPVALLGMAVLLALPLVFLGLNMLDTIDVTLRSSFALNQLPASYVYASPQAAIDLLADMVRYAGFILLALLAVSGVNGLRKGLAKFATNTMPTFQVLPEGQDWRGRGMFRFMSTVLVGVLSGILANILYTAYVA
jgi:hypothetical protein